MSGRIFVHVGLPKTATTTLQTEFFPALINEKIHYNGVFQPKLDNKQGEFYTKFCEAVFTGSALEEVRSSMARTLGAGISIILSEEMITVSRRKSSWRTKLKNLAELLRGFDYVLILTIREPTAAMFSYYVELNEKFSKEKKSFLELAKYDERMHIFHYQKLTDEIFQHFERERLFVKKFEDIVAGELDDLSRLITSGRKSWHSLRPPKHNEKQQAENVVYTGKRFTLADIARCFSISFGKDDASLGVKMEKALAPVVRLLDSVVLYQKKVMKPSKEEMGQLKHYLKEETAALERRFGIRYE